MKNRNDGSIQSGNIPTSSNIGKRKDYAIYRAMVIGVKFSDNIDNITYNAKIPRVLYDVVVLGGFASGQLISNCRMSTKLGGNFAFYELLLNPASFSTNSKRLEDQDGDIVYVQFNQGDPQFPIIVGLDYGLSNDSHKLKGASANANLLFRSLLGGVYTQLEKNGFYTKSWGFTNIDELPAINTLINPENESITTEFKSGMRLTQDGKNDTLKIETKGGIMLQIDGNSNKATISSGGTTLIVDGNSGKISLQGNFVDLGASVSDMVTKYTELASAFNSHIHPVPQSTSGVMMSSPPVMPLLPSVGSMTVKVQD